jgi:hypothetical protein
VEPKLEGSSQKVIAKRLFVSRVGTPKLHKTKAGKNIVTQNIYCFEKMSSQF